MKRLYHTVRTCLRLLISACGKDQFARLLLFTGLLALLPAFSPLLYGLLVDRLNGMQGEKTVLTTALLLLGGLLLINLTQSVCNIITRRSHTKIYNNASDLVRERLIEKCATVKVKYFDNPDFFQLINRVSGEAPDRINNIVSLSIGVIGNIIGTIAVMLILAPLNWLATLVILVGTIPSILIYARQNEKQYDQGMWEMPFLLQQVYIFNVITKREYLREVRFGRLADHLNGRYNTLTKEIVDGRNRLTQRFLWLNIVSNIFSAIAFIGALAIVVMDIISGSAGVGSFAVFYGSMGTLVGNIVSLSSKLISISTNGLYIADYEKVMDYESEPLGYSDEVLPERVDLAISHLDFAYPDTDRQVLKDISLQIRSGEKIAIVGENGSGKSTLIALICGLYDLERPDAITLNGLPMDDCRGLLRNCISCVFQEFGHYQFTIWENIAIGDDQQDRQIADIVEAAEQSDAASFIDQLDEGVHTNLGVMAFRGTDLSGGQWQKLALARALIKKQARIMILDEPTAALDPVAELEMYKRFSVNVGDRTVLLVSHRLGATKLVDRIVVMDDGRIAEMGTHEQLMAKEGLYKRMYEAQAQWY